MTPSPDFARRQNIDVSPADRGENLRRIKNEYGGLLFRLGFNISDYALFSDPFQITQRGPPFPEGLPLVTEASSGRLETVLDIPTVFEEEGEISWYSVLKAAIHRWVQGEEPRRLKKLKNFLQLFGVGEIEVGKAKALSKAEVNLEGRVDSGQPGELLTVYLPAWLSEDQEIADLAAISLIPGEVIGKNSELVVIRPDGRGYRSFLLSRRGERKNEIYLAEYDENSIKFGDTRIVVLRSV